MPSPNNKLAQIQPVQITDNIKYLFKALTDGTAAKMSGGRIPTMNSQAASGLIGSWIVETGRPGLQNLDVIERVNGMGRGISQYTGARRSAYEKARSQAVKQGIDPNSPQWQLQYFVHEYLGKHDPAPGKSLIGYTRVFERAPKNMSPAEAAKYFTGSASAGTGYFRPSVPHLERRGAAAEQIFNFFNQPQAPAQPPANNWLQKLGIPLFNKSEYPNTPVRYDQQMKMIVPTGPSRGGSTPVRYDPQMKLMAPLVRSA